MLPSVAIVILNYNGRHYLEQFLPSVLASSYANKRIVVADNASTDDSIAFIQQQYPSLVELLLNTENMGFAGGYNWALQQVQADYYVLLNSDVEVQPHWIEPVIHFMEANTQVGACQPKLLAFHNKTLFEYAGASGGWLDTLGYPFSRGRVFDVCETDNGQYNNPSAIFWATGAAMFVRANVFHQARGFDAFFFAHMEEIDLCWRIQLMGHSIYAVPASVVYHVGGGTLPKGFRKTYLNFRNNLIMLYKNLPVAEKIWKLPFRFLLDMITALKALVSKDADMARAIIKAHWDALAWFFSKKNNSTKLVKPLKSLSGVYKGWVVWKYFAQHKKTFTEIVGNKAL